MHTHADKTQESKNQSVLNDRFQAQRSSEPTFQFANNRTKAITQQNLQEIAHNSSRTMQLKAFEDIANNRSLPKQVAQLQKTENQNNPPIQLKPINKSAVREELMNDKKGKNTLSILDTCQVIECTDLKYKNKSVSAYGVTLPNESPPVIYINQKIIPNDQVAALTLFHESQHVVDKDTPAKDDNSEAAVKQDNVNEAKVWREEAIYALERGGAYLEDAISQNAVEKNPLGDGYVLNEKTFKALSAGAYDMSDPRSNRFNKENYKPINPKDLSGGWYLPLASSMGYAGTEDKSEFNPNYPGLEFSF